MPVAKAVTTTRDLLNQLSRRFDVDDVGQRVQGGKRLDYIGIDKTITRFNEVLGVDWSFTVIDSSLDMFEGKNKSGQPVTKYLATVTGEIQALDKRAGGVGADVAEDPDKAIKTALAEALKKSSNQFGLALYLWNEDERNTVQEVRQAIAAVETSGDDISPLKLQVMYLAESAGVPKVAQAIADHFGVKLEQLQEKEVLQEILARG